MIDAFEILRNSDSLDYHNGTTMNFETGAERRSNPSNTAKIWPFGVIRRGIAVVRIFIGTQRVEGLQ